jgi:hypothetical protein
VRVTVPEATQLTAAATFCDSGADTRRGRTRPGAWIAISIQAVGSCMPDASGRMYHGVMKFYIPGLDRVGKRRRCVGTYTPEVVALNETIDIAMDQGTGWVGSKAALFLTGGTPGDVYDVTITEDIPRDETDPERVIDVYEDPFRYRLTSYFVVPEVDGHVVFADFPAPPAYHQWFEVVSGSAALLMSGGARLPLDEGSKPIPLSSPKIQVTSGVYLTKGEI